jgi:hypothetical protein
MDLSITPFTGEITQKGSKIKWVLEIMKDPNIQICELIESRMNEIINKINQMDSAIEAEALHSELRILDWILYQACSKI